ncbi:hypothetical protein GCM10008024_35260 [Allgaiera indica]|uniref:ParB/Sulfiredoxin domain-containing protein n=1 Tax=Allgaiera indica TaxID=765699 RepID=A0AAN4UU54_9RHOB|nr:hypothetical protein [Allgaiera indica]GHE05230.1 hypothetical protein GCM10008024_35260 [Allgaiera indica]SDX68371.1 hypothetical protein SAMN05444006_12417 [Allgaiera indica]
MAQNKVDLETSLVASELRDKLFRVDPRGLTSTGLPQKKLTEKYVARIVEGLIAVGVCTPILVDDKAGIFTGHGLVAAANVMRLDDIPALNSRELTSDEWEIYIFSARRFFDISGLGETAFKREMQHILEVFALWQAAQDKYANAEGSSAA